jgi:protein-L-isoaspartate(D-aspartate) O-methyltransferase
MKGLTRSIAFERVDGYWRSQSIEELGFVPMRGAGSVAECNLPLGSHADITLRIDDGQAADAQALSGALDHPATLTWTGVTLPAEGLGHLDFWLADLAGFGRMIVHSRAATDRGFIAPIYNWGSMAVFGQDTFAYLTERPGTDPDTSSTRRALSELGVCAYGPRGRQLANRVADRIGAWDRDRDRDRDRQSLGRFWVEVHPAGTGGEPGDLMIIDKCQSRVLIRTAPRTVTHNEDSQDSEQRSGHRPRHRNPARSAMTDRVRGLLITPDGDLLTIQRIRPGQAPYWVLPGGGVEDGEDLETALGILGL